MAEGLAGVFGNPILRAVTLATATFIFCHSAYSAAFLLHLTKDLEFDSRIVSVVLGIGALGGVVGAASSPSAGRAIGIGPVLMVGLAVSTVGMSLATLITEPRWAAVACVSLSQFILSAKVSTMCSRFPFDTRWSRNACKAGPMRASAAWCGDWRHWVRWPVAQSLRQQAYALRRLRAACLAPPR
ncbi:MULTISPECIES: hypothetical protein [Bradyrhizobium]|uniref:Uncharacterized protein n=3 Tax=Bradyrhizobium TaxID=374 RepID=A0A973WTQ0_9BRAD|nr:hypothetical protein [Bradyrhizobium quebecense]UGA44422.1 hypothetical protein HU230_0041020 [Bradyrhizobium quebecense]UGY00635.1 hypothetical protein J4P68_0026100 [Bradyrhizobium quebecense]